MNIMRSIRALHQHLDTKDYPKERERRSRPKEEPCLMLNLVLEKEANEHYD